MASGKKEKRSRGIPKIIGYDGEMGNFISGLDRVGGTSSEASRALIREIPGLAEDSGRFLWSCSCNECEDKRRRSVASSGHKYYNYSDIMGAASMYLTSGNHIGGTSGQVDWNPQDHDRRFMAENGGCIYIDLNHIEVCVPETRSAFDHVACWHAQLEYLRGILAAANQKLPDGQKINVLVNNSDGRGNAYGSHMNFLVTRQCWQDIFERRMQYLLYLAAYQVSSIVFTGQGKVGSENGRPEVDFQLSQRADFFEQIVGPHTTYSRPVVNSRDESHCTASRDSSGRIEHAGSGMARLHSIFFDNTLCHGSTLLKAGVMQIVLAMIEAGHVNLGLLLEDPVTALGVWSHDPGLKATAKMCSGRNVTAVELQMMFLEEAARFVSQRHCDDIVPRAHEIVELWADTLEKLRTGNIAALSSRLDWALKFSILNEVISGNENLDWQHPAVKRLDHIYSSLDKEEGLFWAYDRAGRVEHFVKKNEIKKFTKNPPEDTRAWTRAMLLREAGPDRVSEVDWAQIQFIVGDDEHNLEHRTVDLGNPFGFTRKRTERVFKQAGSLVDIIDGLSRNGHRPKHTRLSGSADTPDKGGTTQ